HQFNDTISLLRSGGNGGFAEPLTLETGNRPSGVAAADFDGDGDIDIAVTHSRDGNVGLYRNQGAPNFLPPILFTVGNNPSGLVAADFDGDGDIDLAVANEGNGDGSAGTISLLRNNGNGTFATAQTLIT